MVGGGQAARASPYDKHAVTARSRRCRYLPAPLHCEITEKTLDGMDRNRAVKLGAVASRLARVIADPTVDGRQRIVGEDGVPSLLVTTGLDQRKPGLNVLARRAAGIARWQQIDVDGSSAADRTGPRATAP
jgi:hypothetical protein